ncbi:hypothetical protein [Gilvimarinus xylanilyticus]|uniref:Uncharacterized protein n=1 Tax=Gilvimarinus xylanilyticus TaxID=2944139 RepID=A0A9X2KTN9_9GAMM|nr:hypothetical protein [Gilvimarinus xylanilyticus]MCP8900086.1 hypothetical protein [Gilvimarinus xylanilyticus]
MTMFKRLMLMMMFALPLAACDTNDGPAEEMGENLDNAAEETGDAMDDAADEVEDAVN